MDPGTLYRDVVETSPDGIWVIDPQGRTLYANPRIAELLGRDPAELEDLTVFDALDDAGREQFAEHLRDLARGRVHASEVECLWVRRDGSSLWVLVRESALYDERGTVQAYLHRVTDYSERRRLFEELRLNREKLAEAQRIARVGSYDWDVPGDRIVPSDELFALYGIPPSEFDGSYDGFLRLVHPEDQHVVDDAVRAALEGADDFDFTVRVVDPRAPAWVRGRGRVFRDSAGTPVLVRGTHQDVSDAKEAELFLTDLLGLNHLMQQLATAANEAETLVEVLAVAKPLLLSRDDWIRGRGYLPDAASPDGLRQLFLTEEERAAHVPEPVSERIDRALAARALREHAQVWDEESDPEHPGIGFPVMVGRDVVAVVVITNSEPFVRHAMVRQMIDQVAAQLGRVAERERAAHELAAARDAAMEASRQKSEFLATMSHEIRTPLNGVIGLADLLLRTDLDPHQQRLASGAQVAGRALLGVINDILDFSKIEAGRLELESVDFRVRDVFDQVASVLAESARAKGLELMVSCHPDVPEHLNGDPTRLAQVLTNLGSNAVKFTHAGEVYVRATALPDADGGTLLRVDVVDTGVGVDPARHQHIFDPFSQADASTTRQYGGTGLGLAISREIVTALGGEMGLESTLGEGARFWFTARLDAAGSSAPDDEDHEPLAGRRVLVVDDNAHNRLILGEHLARWGAQATMAPGAGRALELLRGAASEGRAFDAVLLDMAMPGLDGMHVATTARAEEPIAGTPFVLLTSSVRPEEDRLREAGIAECLTKPVLADQVLTALQRVLEGGHGHRRTPDRAPAGQGGHPHGRGRLLVVEDNEVNRLVALGILETLGYDADTADDGEAAVAMWQRGDYAAVLMDVQMPLMDGYAATRAIRALEPDGRRVPVLAMTAAAVEGERERCLEAGMDDFLTKPVDPESLAAMLGHWLRGEPARTTTPDAGDVTRAEHEVDELRLAALRDLDPGRDGYLGRAISSFVDRAPAAVAAIRSAVAAADHDGLTHAAHRLKGSALNLGLLEVGRRAHDLEVLGDSRRTAEAGTPLGDLEAALAKAVTAVEGYRDRHLAGLA